MPISPLSWLTDPLVPEVLSSAFHMTEARTFLITQGWSLAKMKTVWRPTSVYLAFTVDINNVFTQLGFFCVTSWRGKGNNAQQEFPRQWFCSRAGILTCTFLKSLWADLWIGRGGAYVLSQSRDSVAFPQLKSAVSLNIFSASFLNPMYHTP